MQQSPQNPAGQGYGGKPDPTPPPCPDPCDQKPIFGPPHIPPECCPKRTCCPDAKTCCTWEEVVDPCIRASATECCPQHTIITCKCESSNKDCNPNVWDCGCYPSGTCVPCKPCEGLIPNPNKPPAGGGSKDPGSGDCTSEGLQKQLDALKQFIAVQQGENTKREADIKAANDRADALKKLIGDFDKIVQSYKEERYKLVCREDCLKGFHRDITQHFADAKKYPPAYLKQLEKVINEKLCQLEMEKCCQVNQEGRLTKLTKLIWEQKAAQKELDSAENAFAIVKDLPKWIGDRFKELEDLQKDIATALNGTDPKGHQVAFFLFYWKFVPKLCKCFPFPFCCNEDGKPSPTPSKGLDHLGCKPGDWHPSAIGEDDVKSLICCASESARTKKEQLKKITDQIADATSNVAFIKKKAEDDEKSLEDRIKAALNKVDKPSPSPTST
jgi:hypothetical protein